MVEFKEYNWEKKLDERERKEEQFARLYAQEFHHGTTGHNQLMLIAKLSLLLTEYEDRLGKYEKDIPSD